MSRITFYWNKLKSTFWFVPLAIISLFVVLASLLLYLDRQVTLSDELRQSIFMTGSADSAKAILSVISSAMISVAGTVFSVTLVVISLASNQFGSRLVKNFMNQRINQIVLGTYVSLYFYCLIILSAVKSNNGASEFIPSLSILVAILATLANIILLIIYIHNVASSIQVNTVISDIQKSISKNLTHIFPDTHSEKPPIISTRDLQKTMQSFDHILTIKSVKDGYIQLIDIDRLIKYITSMEGLLSLDVRAGDYVIEGGNIGQLYTFESVDANQTEKEINALFITGSHRTPNSDLEYSIQQMVQVATKALSPGVNDPFTAITCIDNLTSTMAHIISVNPSNPYEYDVSQNLRLIRDTLDFDGILNTAFNQIRQYSIGNISVIIRLMEALDTLFYLSQNEVQKKAILRQVKMHLKAAEASIQVPEDLEDLKKKATCILA